MIEALEQDVGCNLCVARVETAAEFVEQLGFAEGAVCMPFGPPNFLAFDAAASYEVDPYLVRYRGSGDLRIVVLVCFR
jgi:hypothetical protein